MFTLSHKIIKCYRFNFKTRDKFRYYYIPVVDYLTVNWRADYEFNISRNTTMLQNTIDIYF